jgi:hypothetical protein
VSVCEHVSLTYSVKYFTCDGCHALPYEIVAVGYIHDRCVYVQCIVLMVTALQHTYSRLCTTY